MLRGSALRIALRQLGRNRVRTALTSLGVLIGVAAVIAMVTIGRGATARVEQDLAGLGQNLLFVHAGGGRQGGPSGGPPLNLTDAHSIAEQVQGVAGVAPTSQSAATAAYEDQTHVTGVVGADAGYLDVLTWTIGTGRAFDPAELLAGADVCLLGETARNELFGDGAGIGERILLGPISCVVVGVLESKGQNTFGQDQDDFVILPLETFQRRLSGNRDVGVIYVSAEPGANTERVQADVLALMTERRHVREGMEPDFTVRDMREIEDMLTGITGILTSFLAAVAAVSLLVGGIGIMNIMMVSVTERTREIGIRLAVGALGRDVLRQFLVEAVVLSVGGGAVGVLFGLLGSYGVSTAMELPFAVQPDVVALAFVFSTLIGVTFGYFPARRAARMNPIDALRHE
ncbi:MAG: ABC transporter permease [Deltaproteobacteria bacterium]|nr:ABC transporter permease [Deltaproteobacteria bacterium]